MSTKDKSLLILGLETATRAGSVAVIRDDLLLASRVGDESISHSTNLLDYVAAVLAESGATLRDVDVIAVASGPGSFTGLRIGLATAKSFSATLVRPCVGIPTLHAVAKEAGESPCTIALLPAGRGEVFAQKLFVNSYGEVAPLDQPSHIGPRDLLDKAASIRKLKWAGEGARMNAELIKARAVEEGIPFRFSDDDDTLREEKEAWAVVTSREALAVSVAKLALERARIGGASTPEQLQAIYVRPSDAELNEQCLE